MLPVSRYPLLKLAAKECGTAAVQAAIKSGAIDFFLTAWIEYAFIELQEKNMLDGVTPVGALDLGRKLFENIREDFLQEDTVQGENEDEI